MPTCACLRLSAAQMSAPLRCLASSTCGEGLWAGPSLRGGLLHWQDAGGYTLGAEATAPASGPEGSLRGGGTTGEDWDAEPSVEVRAAGAGWHAACAC